MNSQWEVLELTDCTVNGNISYGIVQPGREFLDGIPIIRVNNFENGSLNTDSVMKVHPDIDAKHSKTKLKGGEVLLTLVGSTGQSVIVPEELKGWNVARAVAVINVKPEIERIQSHKQKDLYQLLPNNWKKYRPKPNGN